MANKHRLGTALINETGRILSADKEFCKIFGFKDSECKWHYITDMVGGVDGWKQIKVTEKQQTIRVRNRRRRGFTCGFSCSPIQGDGGKIKYRCWFDR